MKFRQGAINPLIVSSLLNLYIYRASLNQAIVAIVAVSKVLLEEYVLDRVPIARLVLGGKVPQRVPVFALMKLTMTGGVVAKGVQWGAISVAHCGLEMENQHRLHGRGTELRQARGHKGKWKINVLLERQGAILPEVSNRNNARYACPAHR